MTRRLTFALTAVVIVLGCSASGTTSQSPASGGPAVASATPSAAATSAAPGSQTPLPGCLVCLPGQLTRPGNLSAGAYKSRYFFGGQLTVTIPDDNWTSYEDSTGELKLQRGDNDAATLDFWLDVYPVNDPDRAPIKGYDGTAKALFDWIAANPNIRISHRGSASLGGMKAEVIDFEPSPKAKNVDPGCPPQGQPCVGMFSFPQWDGFYSQGGPFRLRMYGADVAWGGEKHAVYGMITTEDSKLFKAFAPLASMIVEGARLPTDVKQ